MQGTMCRVILKPNLAMGRQRGICARPACGLPENGWNRIKMVTIGA
jgi:hypothetical protein